MEKSLPSDLFTHSSFWSARLESLCNPVAIRMAQDLDPLGPLGIGDGEQSFWKGFKHNFGASDSSVDFLFRIKKTHSQKIILIQIGEFYETWGIDSVFLVEHCGINRMGRKGPRAGMPLNNIQSVLDDLTAAGFSVVVCEQVDDIHKKGRKVRFISEIITPSSPTYTYGLAMSHKANICFPEAPPEFGLAVNSKGVKLVEINPDLRTTFVLEGLTQEAAIIRLNKYSGRLNRIFLHEKTPKSLLDAANLKFHNLIKVEGYSSRNFAKRMEELIKIDLALDANIEFLKVEAMRMDDCPAPLYQNTAEQIGILPRKGIPDLVQLMLPKGAPATCKYIVRNLLLSPPPKKYADSLRQALAELQSDGKKLPILIVSNPVRYIKTLNKSEAHPEILKDLFCLAEIFLNCQKNLSKNFIENSLEIISYISSIKTEEKILQNTAKKIIDFLVDILPKEEDLSYIPRNQQVPGSLFERIEEEFRGRISRNSTLEIAALYEKIEKAAKKYEEILEKKLLNVIADEGKKSTRMALSYDIHNNAIWLLGAISSKNIEQYNLIRPIDRYGKEVKDRFTTKEVEDALQEYKEIAAKIYEAIKQILKKASKELSPYCLPIIHLATFSNLVKTLYLHIKECQVKNWTINFIGAKFKNYDENSGKNVQENSRENLEKNSSQISLTDFFPYWMKAGEAVTNSLNFENTCLLTGHNMAGKSTLIRSLAATTLLGSCGFMFPAKKLTIATEIDGWYVRTGASDDPEAGLSAFAVEMTDIKVALRDATQKSFLLIDELGKGTESKAGHAIAASVLEHLSARKIRAIFATHWHEIFVNKTVQLENIRLLKMHCNGDIPTYKLEEGVDLNSAAFYTAAKIGVKQEIIARAKEIAAGYEKKYHPFSDLAAGKFSSQKFPTSELFSAEFLEIKFPEAKFSQTFFEEDNCVEYISDNAGLIKHAKKILATISKSEISQIKNLAENETPPLNDSGHSIVYILKTANNFFYVGETDNFLQRVKAHRSNLIKSKCEFFYTVIKNGKSQARQIEQQIIAQLKNNGFPMLSIADETNSSFGMLQVVG